MYVHIFNPTLDEINGVTKLTLDLAIALAKNNIRVILYSRGIHKDYASKIGKFKYIEFEKVNTNVLLDGMKTLSNLIMNRNAVKIIAKNVDKEDLIILTDAFYLARDLKKMTSAKILLYHYFPYSLSYRFWKTDFAKLEKGSANILQKILSRIESIYYKRYVDLIIVYSGFVATIFKKYLGINGVAIPPPIDTTFYEPLTKDFKMILTVTRFHPDKELDILIKWFIKYIDEDTEFIVAGRILDKYFWYYTFLQKLAAKDSKNRVKVVGSPSECELKNLYGRAFIFWYIHQEHCATTPVEAMSAGAIPIILDKPGLREAIIHGKTGFIAKNKEEFIMITKMLLNNPNKYREISVNARLHAIKQYSHEAFARKLLKVLEYFNLMK